MMIKRLLILVTLLMSTAFLNAADSTYAKTLQNKTFIFSDSGSVHYYTFTINNVKMTMNMGGKDYSSNMDILSRDDQAGKIIVYPSKADRNKTLAANKNVTFNYVVYFWEKLSETEVKLIIPKITGKTLDDAKKIIKPDSKDANVIMLKKK